MGTKLGCTGAVWAALALAAAAGACGRSKDKEGGRLADKSDARPAGRSPADDSSPRKGGNVILPSSEPLALNPVLQTRFDRANPLIFEGLVGLDNSLELVPELAESWTLSPDGKTITFNLRKNVKWQDKQPFTSADVAFTVEAIRKTAAPCVWKAYLSDVTVETPDEQTVVVKYPQPYGAALASWTVGIIPKHAYGGVADVAQSPANREPVGTGPFRLARWEPGASMVLRANDEWWFGRPYLDTVELVLNVPYSEMLQRLKQGQLDFIEITDVSEWGGEAQTPEFRELFDVAEVVESRNRMIAWNTQRTLFEDKRVRVALTHALNRARVIDDVVLGQARPLSAPFFPTMFGADPSIGPYPFDLDKAVKLLDEAGYKSKNGRRFAIDLIAPETQRNPSIEEMMAVFRHDLEAIGIELRVTYLDNKTFDARTVLREFDAAYFGYLPDIADPDPYALLHSSQINTGQNYAGYSNADVDKLLEQARALTDRNERRAAYYKLHALLHAEEPYTMLYAPYGHYAWSRRLRGVSPNDIGAQPRFPGLARWWVAPATRQARGQ